MEKDTIVSNESWIGLHSKTRGGVRWWVKFDRNCTWNTLTALTLCDTSQVLENSPSGKVVVRALLYELASIARALGHNIEDSFIESLVTGPKFTSPGYYSSMYVDACHGRPMEVDVSVNHILPTANSKINNAGHCCKPSEESERAAISYTNARDSVWVDIDHRLALQKWNSSSNC